MYTKTYSFKKIKDVLMRECIGLALHEMNYYAPYFPYFLFHYGNNLRHENIH
jgi:hypothetical protein